MFYSLLFGGLGVIVVANRLRIGKRVPAQREAGRGLFRGRPRLLVILLLSLLMAVQLGFIYYLGEQSAPFSIQVDPQYIENGVVGHSYVFSVSVQEGGEGTHQGEAVKISVFAPDTKVNVTPEAIFPWEIAKITAVPEEASEGRNLTIIIYGRRSRMHKVKATIMVVHP